MSTAFQEILGTGNMRLLSENTNKYLLMDEDNEKSKILSISDVFEDNESTESDAKLHSEDDLLQEKALKTADILDLIDTNNRDQGIIDAQKADIRTNDKVHPERMAVISNDTDEKTKNEERQKINEISPYSEEINQHIRSLEELEHYMKIGLKETEINGRKCLVQSNIDCDRKDDFGRTNAERMKQGLAPIDKDGNPIELHHIGQKDNSPLAELTYQQHRGDGNSSILHTRDESQIDRPKFDFDRRDHWQDRIAKLEA